MDIEFSDNSEHEVITEVNYIYHLASILFLVVTGVIIGLFVVIL